MVKVIALQSLPYGKKRYAAGDEVEVSEKDARLLIGIKRARAASAPVQSPPAPLKMKAPTREVEAAPEAPPHPQQYHRRDLTAEPTGQTGPARASQLSPRGRPSRDKT